MENIEACSLPHRQPYNDDNLPTPSSQSQEETEKLVADCLLEYRKMQTYQYKDAKLYKKEHERFLLGCKKSLPKEMKALDASKPWLSYYIVNSLDLLWNDAIPDDKNHKDMLISSMASDVEAFLCECCQNSLKFNSQNCFPTKFSYKSPKPDENNSNPELNLNPCHIGEGGFGGGPLQTSHLCATYAAVNGLAVVEKYSKIDRLNLYKYLLSLKDPVTGAFHMHKNGEIDVRGCYCALSVASMLGLLTDELCAGVGEWIVSCQSAYDGGVSAYPGQEAHGGYTFCGLAAMLLLNKSHWLDLNALQNWIIKRQMSFEGGFQGRTNKLVDACYSFWVGSCVPMIQTAFAIMNSKEKIEQFGEKLQNTGKEEEFIEIFRKDILDPVEFGLLFGQLNINPALVWNQASNFPDKSKNPLAWENYQKNLAMRKYFNFKFPNILEDLDLFPPKPEKMEEVEEEEDEVLDIDLAKHESVQDLHPEIKNKGLLWMDQNALQEYIVVCCQSPLSGGLKDKPGVNRDIYHTNYALCGLSIAQNNPIGEPSVLGLKSSNKLSPLNPLYGVCVGRAKKIVKFFGKKFSNDKGDVPN